MNDIKTIKKPDSHTPRLSDFIRQNLEPIIKEWIDFAKTRTPASNGMTMLALRDHIEEILTFIADDMETAQTDKQQFDKSRGLQVHEFPLAISAAETHAELRLADGFDIEQMVSEYRALRASVVKQWSRSANILTARDINDLTRFNEAIDQALSESVAHYTKSINHSRNLFLGVLGHDLRNPIAAASMAANLVGKMGGITERQSNLLTQILSATERVTHILNDVLDITRSSFGMEMPISKNRMDMAVLAREIVEETCTISKNRIINLSMAGQTEGNWDRARMGQVLSNILGNAVQYSSKDTAISVAVDGTGADVLISVHNEGDPIPQGKMKSIFESLTRGLHGEDDQVGSANLGLGLYIAKKIVEAHHGKLEVVSSQEEGTTFTVRLSKIN